MTSCSSVLITGISMHSKFDSLNLLIDNIKGYKKLCWKNWKKILL
ncbi:MAG: hypothetical protein JWR61_2159 [Ferruginibacter sp.]|nr:hypothetical protein [Ferruginibacter sp.]